LHRDVLVPRSLYALWVHGRARTAIAQGSAGAVKHKEVRERPLHRDVLVP